MEAALGDGRRHRPRAAGSRRVNLLPRYLDRLRSASPPTIGPAATAPHRGRRAPRRADGLLRALVPTSWGEVRILHGAPDPLFGGLHPEPIPPHLDQLAAEVRATGADLGVAMDGDGDRLGAVTGSGRYVTPHEVLTLLVRHLVKVRGWRGEVAKGFAMGVQVDHLCRQPRPHAPRDAHRIQAHRGAHADP